MRKFNLSQWFDSMAFDHKWFRRIFCGKDFTSQQLYDFASTNGLEETKKILRKYVTDGEPMNFCPYYTTRSMCGLASMGLEGIPREQNTNNYLNTKHGSDLYWHMWGSE